MLHAAASLTLDLAEAALEEGFGLKDATPYNVLFRGAQPVFVDVLSFERRDPAGSNLAGYGQFVRTFLLPLAAHRYFGLPVDRILSGQRDGIEPETIYRVGRLAPSADAPAAGPGEPAEMDGGRRARTRTPIASQASRISGTGAIHVGRVAPQLPAATESAGAEGARENPPGADIWTTSRSVLAGATLEKEALCQRSLDL